MPYFGYGDAAGALRWLAEAFGFVVKQEFSAPDGTVDTDFGTRRYRALDPEGYGWSFGTYSPAP